MPTPDNRLGVLLQMPERQERMTPEELPPTERKWFDFVDFRIGVGSIASSVLMCVLFFIGVYGNVITGNVTDKNAKEVVQNSMATILGKLDNIQTEQQRVREALPLTARDLADAQRSIIELQKRMEEGRQQRISADNTYRDQLARDETQMALLKQQVEGLSDSVKDLYNASRAQVATPRNVQRP